MRRIRSMSRLSALCGVGGYPPDTAEAEGCDAQVVRDLPAVADPVQGCGCESAVRMAYWNMISCGRDHCTAFRVAERVCRWHFPTLSEDMRERRIIDWVRNGPLH